MLEPARSRLSCVLAPHAYDDGALGKPAPAQPRLRLTQVSDACCCHETGYFGARLSQSRIRGDLANRRQWRIATGGEIRATFSMKDSPSSRARPSYARTRGTAAAVGADRWPLTDSGDPAGGGNS